MEPANDISHPVLDAFQELGHRARVAATSVYVALPVLMASAPSVAYGHETGQLHTHACDPCYSPNSIQPEEKVLMSAVCAISFLGLALYDHRKRDYKRLALNLGMAASGVWMSTLFNA